jgi:hypothetical protein
LRQLRVKLQQKKFESVMARRKVAEPMMEIRGLRIFELLLPLEEDWQWDFLEDAPFAIVVKFSRAGRREIT